MFPFRNWLRRLGPEKTWAALFALDDEGKQAPGSLDGPYVSIKYNAAPDAYSLFTFSERNKKPSKFSFFKSSHEEQLHRFMFNCIGNTWYTQGIAGFSEDFEETLERLRGLLAVSRNQNTVFMGSSMGAYGATLFGSLCNVRRVIGFGTEVITNLPGSYSSQNLSHLDVTSPFYRLDSLVSQSQTIFDFFAGECSPVDLFAAAAANRYANTRLHVIANSDHAVVNHLKGVGVLQTIVDQGLTHQRLTVPQAYYAHPIILDYLSSYSYEYDQAGFKKFAADYIDFYLNHKPDVLPENYISLYGFLYKARYFDEALALLERYVKNFGDNEDIQFRRLQVMYRQGRFAQVLETSGAENLAEAQYFRAVSAQKLFDLSTCSTYLASALELATTAGKKKLAATIVALQKKIGLPEASPPVSMASDGQAAVGDEAEAIAAYVRSVQTCRSAKQFEEAETVALAGLNAFPESASLQSEYAWNAQTEKRWPAAVERLEKLRAMQGAHAGDKIYVRLAQAYRHSGNPEKADAILQVGSAKFPKSIRIQNESVALTASRTKPDSKAAALSGDKTLARDLLLTTFPGHKSKNVGDNLISHSAFKMLAARNPGFLPIMAFREASLDHYADGAIRNIIAPGFSVSNGVYPGLFSLYSDLERMPNFYPIGCSFQHTIPSRGTFENYEYGQETLAFLRFITTRSGALPCRDQLIVELLRRHGIPAVYSGDLAIYDEEKLNSPFVPPREINSVVFTIQHHPRYEAQSFRLLELIKARFTDAKLYVAFHSKADAQPQKIADHAVGLGYTELHLYGEVENLDVYDEVDLHIGYRLHGHISFLRRRKPSVLLVEDARSFGFAHTPGTDVGCFEAISLTTLEADPVAPERAMAFVAAQIECCFQDYQGVFNFIDKTHAEFIKPYFDDLAQKTL